MQKMKLVGNNKHNVIKLKSLTIAIIFLGLSAISWLPNLTVTNSNNSIIGTWVAEEDSKSKLIFLSNGRCNEYYNNLISDQYTFVISNTSPQCGEVVRIDSYTSYLKMVSLDNSDDQYCYEINGITSTKLSLRLIDQGGYIMYTRQ